MLILNAPCSHSSSYYTALRLLLACFFSLWVTLEVEAPTYLDFDCNLFFIQRDVRFVYGSTFPLLNVYAHARFAYDVHALRSLLLHTRTRSNTNQIASCEKSFPSSNVKLFANAHESLRTPSPCNAPLLPLEQPFPQYAL